MNQDYVMFQQKSLLNLVTEARALCDKRFLTDITLQCDGEIFAAHKVILASNSPYFREYFFQKETFALRTMTVDFLTSEVLRIILDYFYTGRLVFEKEQSSNLLKPLIVASSLLQVPLLSNYCLELLLNKRASEISVSDWKAIEELENKVVFDIFLQNVVQNIDLRSTTQDFLQLSANQMKELFQCPAVAEADQTVIFQSIFNWVKHDPQGRKQQLTEFLENFVDFERLNPVILTELQNEHILIENAYFVRSYFKLLSEQINGKGREMTPSQIGDMDDLETQNISVKSMPRISSNGKNSLEMRFLVYDFKKKLLGGSHICLYDYGNNKIDTMIAHPLLNAENAAIIYFGDCIYSFGGSFNNVLSSVVYSYNVKTKYWVEKSPMLNVKYVSAVISLNGYMYVVGVSNEKGLLSMERFDANKDQWKAVADLPDYKQESSDSKDKLESVNQKESLNHNSSIPHQYFVPEVLQSPVVGIPSTSFCQATLHNKTVPVAAVNDCLFVLLKNKLYKYSPEDDEWHLVETELNKQLHVEGEVHMTTSYDKIFIIEKMAPKAMWIYDPKENSLNDDIIPSVLTECHGMMNLENSGNLEFLVSGNDKWFIYKPPNSWSPVSPKKLKDFQLSMLTLIPS